MIKKFSNAWRWWAEGRNLVMPRVLMQKAPLDLRIVGRMLLHAALVGAAAGLCGALFFAGAEFVQHVLLELWAGYAVLHAQGETFIAETRNPTFNPWLLMILPALGAGVGGLVGTLAPETRGGGGNAMIDAFHHRGARVRFRVIWVRTLAAIATLSSGGSGGREGPTMQIGGAIGSAVADFLRMGSRERRILYVAGVAAGMAAVFRTPLGAALLAVEVLYRDDFEAEALVPAILASVVAYSVVIAIFGEGTSLFGTLPRFAYHPWHLPLYGMLALCVALVATVFLRVLHGMHHLSDRLPVAAWLRPAFGGLGLGVLATAVIVLVSRSLGTAAGQGLGLLGSGYGEIQLALTGSDWLPATWRSVQVLAVLLVCKLLASCLTIGTGGSAGDFAPSLVLGGLVGGVFGRAAALLLGDPTLTPGPFVLVGMAAFYGGIAHTPLSSLIMACEMAGSYDLLVPLMLAEGIAFIVLRRQSLYPAQVNSLRDSPVHRDVMLSGALTTLCVRDVMVQRPCTTFAPNTSAADMLSRASAAEGQMVFPVIAEGKVVGLVAADLLRLLASEPDIHGGSIAVDFAQKAVVLSEDATLRAASTALISSGMRALPVVSRDGAIITLLDETDIAAAYLRAADRAEGP